METTCLHLSLHVEVEPYKEIVDIADEFSIPSGSRSASPVSVDRNLPPAQSLSQGPSTSVYNANPMTSVMRPDPRYELAWVSQCRILRQSTPRRRRWQSRLHHLCETSSGILISSMRPTFSQGRKQTSVCSASSCSLCNERLLPHHLSYQSSQSA